MFCWLLGLFHSCCPYGIFYVFYGAICLFLYGILIVYPHFCCSCCSRLMHWQQEMQQNIQQNRWVTWNPIPFIQPFKVASQAHTHDIEGYYSQYLLQLRDSHASNLSCIFCILYVPRVPYELVPYHQKQLTGLDWIDSLANSVTVRTSTHSINPFDRLTHQTFLRFGSLGRWLACTEWVSRLSSNQGKRPRVNPPPVALLCTMGQWCRTVVPWY